MRLQFAPRIRTASCELRVHPTGGERVSTRLDKELLSEDMPPQICGRLSALRYDVSGLRSLRRTLGGRGWEPEMLVALLGDLRVALAWLCVGDRRNLVVPYDSRHVFIDPQGHLRLVCIPLAGVRMAPRFNPLTLLGTLCDAGTVGGLGPQEAASVELLRSFVYKTQGAVSLNRLLDTLDKMPVDGSGTWALLDLTTSDRYPLMPGIAYLMGRGDRCDIRLATCTHVSRRHARVRVCGDSVRITDLGSANGTTVDGRRIDAHEEVRLGPGTHFDLAGRGFVVEGGASRP